MEQTEQAFAAFDRGEMTCEAEDGRCPKVATYLSGGGAFACMALCDTHPLCACGNYVLHSKQSSKADADALHYWHECQSLGGLPPFRRECSNPTGNEHERRAEWSEPHRAEYLTPCVRPFEGSEAAS